LWIAAVWLFTITALVAGELRAVVAEDFESYADTAAMQAVWGTKGLGLIEAVPQGSGHAAYHPGGAVNARHGFALQATAAESIVLTADFYDFATNANKRLTVGLRNGTGAILELGAFNSKGSYFARVVGFAGGTSWKCFDESQRPIQGWHRFQALISPTNTVLTLDLGADGIIDKQLEFPGSAAGVTFNELRFGGPSDVTSLGGGGFFDNIRLETRKLEPLAEIGPAASVARAAETAPAAASQATSTTTLPGAPKSNMVQDLAARAGDNNALIYWVAGGLGVIIVLLAALVLLVRRGAAAPSGALVPTARAVLPDNESSGSLAQWQQRALTAEALASQQGEILRNQVVPELTEFAKQSLVQGLYQKNQNAVQTQEKARRELEALEARLATLQAPLQDRILAYETRIRELEQQLDTRGEEMRELIHATLLLVRQKLEDERGKRGDEKFN
jgi:hypothetical protein